MVLDNFVTWKFIASYMGTVIITMLTVQFLKELPFIKRIPTRYFTFIIAFLNIIATNIATNSFLIPNLYLMFINAIITTFTATGGYDFAIKTIRVDIDKKDE